MKKDTRKIYDESEQVYKDMEEIGSDFKSVQEFLANHWIDVPDGEEDGDMYDKIMTAKLWDQLEEFASGLGYILEEDE